MTYADLFQILIEAEARRDDESIPAEVRDRSSQTVALVKERMAREGLTRSRLAELAAA